MDWLGGLEEALAHVDELKLVQKAGKGLSGKSAYGELKEGMYRETIGYLENWGSEHDRDYAIAARRRRERETSEGVVKAWEAKAKL